MRSSPVGGPSSGMSDERPRQRPDVNARTVGGEIIVLDRGVIVERGSHHQLLAKGGLYASMWNRQREAAQAREKLALVDDEPAAPNRNPPTVAEILAEPSDDEPRPEPPIDRADAAE